MGSRARLVRVASSLAAVGLLVAGCGAEHAGLPTGANAPTDVGQIKLAGVVHEIVPDPKNAWLWFASFDGSYVYLNKYDEHSAEVTSIQIGSSSSSGLSSHIRFAPDGTLWVSDDYSFFGIDTSNNTVRTFHLPLSVADQLPAATEPSDPLPGTWVSAFDFDLRGNLVVSRNNVPSLEVIDQAVGAITATIQLAADMDGMSDMTLTSSGLMFIPSHSHAGRLGISPVKGEVQIGPFANNSSWLRGTFGPGFTEFSGAVPVVLASAQSVAWTQKDGSQAIWMIPGIKESVVNPVGETQVQVHYDPIEAGVVDAAGDLWLLEDRGDGLTAVLKWTPPAAG